MAEREDKLDEEKAFIHGGGVKVGRVHMSLVSLRNSRRNKDWDEAYYCLEDLFTEVEAYLRDQERTDIMALWKEVTKAYQDHKLGVRPGTLMGVSFAFEIKIRKVLARLQLDMQPKEKEKFLGGAMG